MHNRPLSPSRLNRRSALGGIAIAAAVLGLNGRAGRATAQEATPSTPATSPIVGAWQWNADPTSPEPSNFALFHADGTYTEW